MKNPATSKTSTTTPCCSKVGIKRGPWTREEDELLANFIKKEGEGRWRTVPKRAGLLRCGKSCRLRWVNYLRPCVKRGRIDPDEEDLILRLHRLLGNRWSLIAGRIPGRTDNEIKNYWNTHLSKKLISQGIDPRTHKPLNLNSSCTQVAHDPNQTSNPTSQSEEPSKTYRVIATKVSENFKVASNDHQNQVVHNSQENWSNCDGLFMGLQGCHGPSNDGEACLGSGNDDTFSSFLDSLVNENFFGSQQQQQTSMIMQSIQPMGTNWDADIMSSMATIGDVDGALTNHPA
ncbi:hypothetical protein K2173_025515 [Erythroxylum novogranatense]|uniref:Uncharacterized protein n=1 Tax=Erythroxylum novogranatense TaxID=1862640 RepID=A0AAV8TA20_9ROSI|nr:hypothetical protein K2173_025515 [Erythroxylum novogranatense]